MSIENGIVDAIQGAIDGTKTLGDVARSVFSQIQRSLIQFGVNSLLTGLFPGSSFFRANGGPVSTGKSYMVGERGPEIFSPSQSGQVLNNSATNHIMQSKADSGFKGAGGGMVISSLTVESAEMNQSNLNIDSFAGNPAMKVKR